MSENQDSSSNDKKYNPWLNRMWIHYFTLYDTLTRLKAIDAALWSTWSDPGYHEAIKRGIYSIETEYYEVYKKLIEEDNG